MKDYRKELFTAFYNWLSSSVVVDGSGVEVGTKISEDSSYFVRYYISSDQDLSTQFTEIRELEISFECVVRQSMHLGNDEIVDEMVEQVKQAIIVDDGIYIGNWQIVVVSDNGTLSDDGEIDGYYVNVRTFTAKIIVQRRKQ